PRAGGANTAKASESVMLPDIALVRGAGEEMELAGERLRERRQIPGRHQRRQPDFQKLPDVAVAPDRQQQFDRAGRLHQRPVAIRAASSDSSRLVTGRIMASP